MSLRVTEAHNDRFLAFSGKLQIGTINKIKPDEGWHWQLMPLYGGVPTTLKRGGIVETIQRATSDLATSWNAFAELAAMETSALRAVKQGELQQGAPDYHIFAGEFLLGRLYEDRVMPEKSWFWAITGLHPSPRGSAPTMRKAMQEIKQAWVRICESATEPD